MGLNEDTRPWIGNGDAMVEIRDYSLWIKHIRGSNALVERLMALRAGDVVRLIIGGHEGVWQKKEDGSNGLPTQGLKPLGEMRERWFRWFRERRGEMVKIKLEEEVSDAGAKARRVARIPLEAAAPEAERRAAWAALKAQMNAGWRSDGPYDWTRGELHERYPQSRDK